MAGVCASRKRGIIALKGAPAPMQSNNEMVNFHVAMKLIGDLAGMYVGH